MQCGDPVLRAISKSYNCYYDKEKNKHSIRFSFSEVQTNNISKLKNKKKKKIMQNSYHNYSNIEI